MGSVIGMLLQSIPGSPPTDWELVLTIVAQSFADDSHPPSTRFVPSRSGPVRSALGDPHHDALIDAVAAITARVGFERATASRIARRANLTSGAIYARYHTKDELLTDAVEVLLSQRFADDLAENADFLSAPDPGTASASSLGSYLSAARRDWRIFRIEAQLASRYRPELAATIDRIQEVGIRANFESLRASRGADDQVLDVMARFRHLIPLGLAFTDVVLPGGASADWRLVFIPLVAVIARAAG
jgi:AcrR family transcriptional regulator